MRLALLPLCELVGMWLEVSPQEALSVSALLSFLFVVSLYIWRRSTLHDRDDPTVIKQRLFSVISVCLIAPIVMLHFAREDTPAKQGPPFTTWIGFTTRGLFYSATLPLVLTASLFLGPMYLHFLQYPSLSLLLSQASTLVYSLSSERLFLIKVRNLLLAPVCEEFIFRGCVISLLLAANLPYTALLLLSPLLFGLAHLHHLVGLMRSKGVPAAQAVAAVGFQLLHTTLFGTFAAYVYLSTGSVVACMLCHAFCNWMEFPDLGWIGNPHHPAHKRRLSVALVFIAGMLLFGCSLRSVMERGEYNNWMDDVRAVLQKHESIGGSELTGGVQSVSASAAEGLLMVEGVNGANNNSTR